MSSKIKLTLLVIVLALAGMWYWRHNSTVVPKVVENSEIDSATDAPLEDDATSTAAADDKPVEQRFSNAQAAFEAARDAAKDGDDLVISQFREPGPGCTWCAEFYTKILDQMRAPGLSAQELSYLGAILASSGRAAEIQSLVDLYKSSTGEENREALAQAIEVSAGGAQAVSVLEPLTREQDSRLEDAALMAMTALQGQEAAAALYRYASERDDADGGYNRGVGLGEYVPDDEALPYVQALAQKRDKFSPLAVKALLNNGPSGLRLVFDLLESSSATDAENSALIANGIDHVVIDPQSVDVARMVEASSKNAVAKQFANQILERSVEPQSDQQEGSLEE